MERANDDTVEDPNVNPVGNNNGRNLKVEALTTVRQLERFLAKSVARQWYDMERATFQFMQKIRTDGPITFAYDVSIWLAQQQSKAKKQARRSFKMYENYCGLYATCLFTYFHITHTCEE